MYLYNISIIVDDSNHESLITWVKQNWLPNFQMDVKFLKMLNTPHEGQTYCVQLILETQSDIEKIHENHLQSLQHHITAEHGEKAFLFDSVMEFLDKDNAV